MHSALAALADKYLQGHDPASRRASPLLGPMPNLPRIRIDVGGDEVLLAEAITYGRRRSVVILFEPDSDYPIRKSDDTSKLLQMDSAPAEYQTCRLEYGDILLNEGQSPGLVGRPAMFRDEVEDACFQNTLIRFRAHPGVSAGFTLLVFRSYLHPGVFRSIAR